MKNILILLIFVVPINLLAQTRPMPKKSNGKTATKNEITKEQKPIPFVYMIMTVEEVKKTKKEDPVIKFKFNSFDSRHSQKMEDNFKNAESVVVILNKLGQRGWELVSVNNENYFFKNRFIGIKR